MVVSAKTFEQIALEEPDRNWELDHGRLREKPSMSFEHNHLMFELAFLLRQQIDPAHYEVRANAGRVQHGSDTYYIPDVFVIPIALTHALRHRQVLEVYAAPLPLVVEVWSPSTGDYDIEEKIPEYQRRGDLEIWRIHPYERILTAWRRQPDYSYTETTYREGVITPIALPNVSIDLTTLFAV